MADLLEELQRNLPALESQLADSAEKSLTVLAKAGVDSMAGISAILRSREAPPELRKTACLFSGLLKLKAAFPDLIAILEDDSEDELTWEAAKAISRFDVDSAVDPLLGLMENCRNPKKAAAIIHALGILGHPRALKPLLAVLSSEKEDPEVRGHAAEALSFLSDRRAVQELILALRDRSPHVRFWASYSLGQLADSEAIPALEVLAENDEAEVPGWWAVKREAADAIRQIRQRLEGLEDMGG